MPSVTSPRLPNGERLALAVLFFSVAAISLLPVLRLVQEIALPGGRPDAALLGRVLGSPAVWRATWNTVVTGSTGAALAVLAGGAAAYLVTLSNVRGKSALAFGFMLPLMISPQVMALAWIDLFGPNSPVLRPLGLAPAIGQPHPLYGPGGIALLFGIEQAPLVYLAVRAGLRAVPAELVEAARVAGSGPWRAFLGTILPLTLPQLAVGGALAFVANCGNFGIPAFLGIPAGYPMLVTQIYQRLNGFGPSVLGEVAALALPLATIALFGLLLQTMVGGSGDRRMTPGRQELRLWRLGRWRLPIEALWWLLLLTVVALPFAALLASALSPALGVALSLAKLTMANFKFVLLEHAATRRAFANSFMISALAAVTLAAVAVPLSYFTVLRRLPALRALRLGAEFPYALPGIVLAVAMILTFLRPLPLFGISIYGTAWIILLAYLARFLPLALGPVDAALRQFDPKQEEVAQTMGAGLTRRLLTIILPAVAPATAVGVILVFLLASNELTVSALLWSSGIETIGVVLFGLEQGGDAGSAAAVAVLSMALTIVLMLLLDRIARRFPGVVVPWRA